MKNRREFLKEMAAGAAILGAGRSSRWRGKNPARTVGKSKVVIVRDEKLRIPGPEPDRQRVAAMLDHAMQTYAGAAIRSNPGNESSNPGR